jgi:hypothetical protein
VKSKAQSHSADDLQHKTVIHELGTLRAVFREVVAAYSRSIEAEFAALLAAVKTDAQRPKFPASRAHDLRDILSCIGDLEVKPEKGRRRDLKQLEEVLEEARRITGRWDS